eukprot:GHVR01084640.1.p2 GENE.GHVR01084640.1~~GHVR01084640.1.p2  ORF type:complete len:216 (-),score=141.08 GHVR01084640.1:974-1543(-)
MQITDRVSVHFHAVDDVLCLLFTSSNMDCIGYILAVRLFNIILQNNKTTITIDSVSNCISVSSLIDILGEGCVSLLPQWFILVEGPPFKYHSKGVHSAVNNSGGIVTHTHTHTHTHTQTHTHNSINPLKWLKVHMTTSGRVLLPLMCKRDVYKVGVSVWRQVTHTHTHTHKTTNKHTLEKLHQIKKNKK